MFEIITVYEELGTGNLIVKRETTNNGRAAKEAFSIYHGSRLCIVRRVGYHGEQQIRYAI